MCIRSFEATDVAAAATRGTARDEERELALVERRRGATGRADKEQGGYQEPHEVLDTERLSEFYTRSSSIFASASG